MNELRDIQAPVVKELEQFNKVFRESLTTENALLSAVLQHATAHKGKQLRPTLVLLTAKMGYGINEKTIQTAAAVEMLHTASLIHDDVIDNSPLRRGISSVQNEWNNKIAVLAGDYLLSKIMQDLIQMKCVPVLNAIAELGMTLTSGELLQLHSKDQMWLSEKDYYLIIEKKTAALFATCAEVGAITGGLAKGATNAMKRFGYHLGMAFQLKDDSLDYSDFEDIGKERMADIRDGKVTLPLLTAINRAPKEESEYIRHLCSMPINAEHAEEIKSFVLRFDGMRYTFQKMLWHKEEALKALATLHPTNANKSAYQALEILADYSIQRML